MSLWTAIMQLEWKVLADIVALTLLLFGVYLWLRGTVAVQVLGGVLSLLAASLAADRLGLLLTGWLLQAVSAGIVVLIVVVFREEIRRGLRRVDPVRWLRDRRRGRALRGPADELARAAFHLADRGLGALLVVPRHDEVDGHLTGASRVDGVASVELLEAIFRTDSPLHDGACVLENGRIRLAGAVLPLTDSAAISGGTRHRAAVGLSEQCDAVVIAVSEERRLVTVFVDGRVVVEGGDMAATRDALAGALGDRPRERRADREPGRGPWRGLAAFAVILVGVMATWSFLVGGRETASTAVVPIELRNIADGTDADLVRPSSGWVRVRVRGPGWLLDGAQLDEISAWVDLGSAPPGRRRLSLKIEAPAGIEVVSASPPNAVVEVRKRP